MFALNTVQAASFPPLNSYASADTSGTVIAAGTNVNGCIVAGCIFGNGAGAFVADSLLTFGPIHVPAGQAVATAVTTVLGQTLAALTINGNVVMCGNEGAVGSAGYRIQYRLL